MLVTFNVLVVIRSSSAVCNSTATVFKLRQ